VPQLPWSPDQSADHFADLQLFEDFGAQSLINETEILFDLNGLNEEVNESVWGKGPGDLWPESADLDLECLLDEIPVGLGFGLGSESSNADYESSTGSVSSSSESESAKQGGKRRRVEDQAMKRVNRGGKVDKKESNKAAAVRYRCKMALEKDRLFAECELYEKKNSEIKSKIVDLEIEIDFIKNLLVQAFLTKNPNAADNSLLSMMSGIF